MNRYLTHLKGSQTGECLSPQTLPDVALTAHDRRGVTAMYYFRGEGEAAKCSRLTHSRGKTRAAGSVWTPSAAAIKVTAQWTTTHRDTSGSSVNSECEIIAAVHGPFCQPSSPLSLSLSIYLSCARFNPLQPFTAPLSTIIYPQLYGVDFLRNPGVKTFGVRGKLLHPRDGGAPGYADITKFRGSPEAALWE